MTTERALMAQALEALLPFQGRGDVKQFTETDETIAALRAALALPVPATVEPIDMVLHCPKCGLQHVDGHDARAEIEPGYWTNPPHRSHLCHGCAWVWRPADVPTNGVAAIKTKGEADSAPLASPTPQEPK